MPFLYRDSLSARGHDLHFPRARNIIDHVTIRFSMPFPTSGPLEVGTEPLSLTVF